MTVPVLPPPAPPAPPAPPPAQPAPSTAEPGTRARVAVVLSLAAMLLTALLNPDDLLRRAQSLPYGWERTAAVDIADANRTVSRALLLDRPRLALDRLFGHEHTPSTLPPPGPVPTIGPTVAPTTTPTTTPTSTPTTGAPFRPTRDHPLRVYIGGDSVSEALTVSFERLALATHVIKTTAEYRFSTGLSRPDYFNWPERLREVVARRPPPHVLVLMFGANDVQPIMTPTGPAKQGTPKWLAEYRRRVAATMTLLSSSGIPVYWVGQPLMRSAYFTARINELDAIYASEAARHPGITFVDSRPLLADSHGHYSAYLPDSSGRPVLVRQPDGVHLTVAGGDRIAAAVLELIEKRWRL